MLATLAALQLALITQIAAPKEVTPDEGTPPPTADAPATAPAPPPEVQPPTGGDAGGDAAQGGAQGGAAQENPPLPSRPRTDEPRRPGAAAQTAAGATSPQRTKLPSLLSAEPLAGASAALAWAGWSSLGAAYAIGFTQQDDVGASLDYDWGKSETRIGVLYRRALGTAGSFDLAGRVGASWYTNFGSTYVYGENHSDRGFEVAPALVLSQRAASGVFALAVEGPMTVTMKYSAGFLFSPRLLASFEVPLYPQVTVGAQAGVGYRAGAGDAPLREGRGELRFLVVAGYDVL